MSELLTRMVNTGSTPDLTPVTGAEQAVYRLLNPRSIAIVGASSRPGSLAWWPLHLLQRCGFGGEIFPVNPNRDELDGIPTLPNLAAIGKPIDVAVIPLNAQRTFEAIDECARIGVGSVVLPTQGFSEVGAAGRELEQQLMERARHAGIRVVGPNCDGVANLATGAVMSIQPLFDEGIETGPVGVVAQSGATAASLIVRLKREGIGVRLSASAGNEADLGLADYMSVMLQDPHIRLVVGFVEAVRKPQDFYRVAALAAALGKGIVLLKVGRSEQGVRRASAHTGALAGEDRVYDAIFRRYGVIRVGELSDLVAVTKAFLAVGELRAPGLGIISCSGGQAGAAADIAKADAVPLPALTPASEAAIDKLLEFGSGFNPCDLTGELAVKPQLGGQVFDQFARTPDIGAVVLIRKKLLADINQRLAAPMIEASRAPGAPALLVYAMDGAVDGVEAQLYRDAGVAVFDSLHDINTSMSGLAAWSAAVQELRAAGPADAVAAAQQPLPAPGGVDGGAFGDAETKRILDAYDLPRPQEVLAADAAEAVAAADRIGYPVVIKIADARIPHKTEMGGVVLDVQDAVSAHQAATSVLDRARVVLDGAEPAGLLVQEQIGGGVEMIAGLTVDPDFGPFVLLGMGGITAEILGDVALRPAPVSERDVLDMIGELRGGRLLAGYRNTPQADVPALVRAVVALSRLGVEHAQQLSEVDLNPIVVLPEGRGVRILDALFVGA